MAEERVEKFGIVRATDQQRERWLSVLVAAREEAREALREERNPAVKKALRSEVEALAVDIAIFGESNVVIEMPGKREVQGE